MARRGWLPGGLASVNPRTRTPIVATLVAGGAVLTFATLLEFEALATLTSLVTLLVFVLVDLSLWRLQRQGGPAAAIRVPPWVPPLGIVAAVTLVLASFL
jgi:amino acid transporter